MRTFSKRQTSQAADESFWTSPGEVDKTCSERRMRAETAPRLASSGVESRTRVIHTQNLVLAKNAVGVDSTTVGRGVHTSKQS
ncbi:hypothetical protein PHBOTO_003882 [Pseudozyma hubeiensis]|nr:hypothetical protein PHBOTO_003882 [Pseudozyma hubeiensis]